MSFLVVKRIDAVVDNGLPIAKDDERTMRRFEGPESSVRALAYARHLGGKNHVYRGLHMAPFYAGAGVWINPE